MDGMEFPWPRKGDRLIGPREDWENNACLNFTSGIGAVRLYADGYRAGAERIAEYVIAEHRKQDTLIYPIVFLWRHYVELRLKAILRTARLLTDQTSEIRLDHRILVLWHMIRPILEEIGPNGDKETLDAVEEILTQIDDVDGDSFAFRYPTTKSGAPSAYSDAFGR